MADAAKGTLGIRRIPDEEEERSASSPSAFVFGCGGFGDVDGLLQSPPQVHGPLLDHLSDVFDPVLFVLDTGGLRWVGGGKAHTNGSDRSHVYRIYR